MIMMKLNTSQLSSYIYMTSRSHIVPHPYIIISCMHSVAIGNYVYYYGHLIVIADMWQLVIVLIIVVLLNSTTSQLSDCITCTDGE